MEYVCVRLVEDAALISRKEKRKEEEDDMIRFKGRKEVGKYKYLSCPVYTVEYKRRNSSPRGGL